VLQVHDPDPSNPAHRVVECTGTLEQVRTAEAAMYDCSTMHLCAADVAMIRVKWWVAPATLACRQLLTLCMWHKP
jgi:hypothetical protein